MILQKLKNLIKQILIQIKSIRIIHFKKTLSLQIFKKFILFIIAIYFKFQIRLVYLFMTSSSFYLLYIYLVAYGLYGGSISGYNNTHLVAFCIVFYLIGTIIELYILCKIPMTRKFLDNLLTKQYIIKYLGF